MRRILATMMAAALTPTLLGAQAPRRPVPIYENLGTHSYPVTVRNPQAQRYFDQGLRLLYAFNHPEAIRAFQEGERLDTTCAMCAWGVAYAAGPNINAAMDSAGAALAYAASRRAVARAGGVGDRERDLIDALAVRYSADPRASRASLDSAFARRMGEVADRWPADLEAQTLHADALMNLSPWNYWSKSGEPRPDTPILLERLERAMAVNPNHPGACHLFIHAVEAAEAERAVPCAERLAALMPGAGHLVHMPGHIYIRVGRYRDAIVANQHAVHADQTYLEGTPVSRRGVYAQGYYPHNWHFLSFAAAMAGSSAEAIAAARKVSETVGPDVARALPWLEAVTPAVWTTLVTFGRWNAVLREPLPPSDLRFTTAMAYYARGMAFAAHRRWAEAHAAVDTVARIGKALPRGDNAIALAIARAALIGEIALRSGRPRAAVAAFREAVALEDGLAYLEPPTWYYPVRQSLGKALLADRKAAEAEQVYRDDLRLYAENGWSLFGLALALEHQGKTEEAAAARARFEKAWEGADVRLKGSRF